MLTNVQVLAGATSVTRLGDVVVWFETGPQGGGVMLTQLLQAVHGVACGSVSARQMGARLAAVLNTGDAGAVPALVAATPEEGGLRVVVHGWGAVVADGIHVPNGWVDQLLPPRDRYFAGRNTAAPLPSSVGPDLAVEDGVVAGDGALFSLGPAPAPAPVPPPPAPAPRPTATPEPIAWPPPPSAADTMATAPPGQNPTSTPPSPGRLVLDDGSSAALERSCVLGSAPHASPAVQTGAANPLTVTGAGVAQVHAAVHVERGQVAVRDLGTATTHVLAPGAQSWTSLVPNQVTPLAPGTRIALGQRTVTYEQP